MRNPIRRWQVFRHLDKAGLGLEIGPGFNPLAPKRDGHNVRILDHLDTEGLRRKYAGHGVDVGMIEPVDYVWTGQAFADLVGSTRFDWIIASHVIEHTPCFIDFLNNCDGVLKDTGVLSLVVPDKRYTFDRLREKTGLSAIIDARLAGRRIGSAGTAADYFLNVTRARTGLGPWFGPVDYVHSLADAKAAMAAIQDKQTFLDMHNWVFSPSSFRLIVDDLFCLGYSRMREHSFFGTIRGEFYMSLSRVGRGPKKSRLALAKASMRES